MDRLQKLFAGIRKNLSGLTPTQKLLIGSMAVIMAMTLFLVSQYAGKPTYTEIWPGAPADDQARAANILKTAGIKVVPVNGKTMVPASEQQQAMAVLMEKGQQPANSAVVFENILKTQNWINSKETNRQIYKVMLDNYLSGVISKFSGVQQATVFVDSPEQVGFGVSARPAKAAVNIFTTGGKGMDQAAVDAAARTVAGSVAGLELERVNISVDGKSRRVQKDDDLSVTTNQQSARAVEQQFESKLSNLLSYIDGVVVAVTAEMDTSRSRTRETKNLNVGDGTVSVPSKEMTSSTTEGSGGGSGAPGVRSNTGASVDTGGGGGNRSEQKQEETTYTPAIGKVDRETENAGGIPTRLVATVRVPRGFVAGLVQRETPAAAGSGGTPAAGPDQKAIDDRFARESASIKQALEPHFKTRGADGAPVQGEVVVMMSSEEGGSGGGGGGGGRNGGGSGGGVGALGTMWAIGGGVIDKAVLGALAVIAVGMMLLMVRKAGKRPELPTAEELVGLPPTLEAKSDLVGEADESETAMAGIEVGEDEIKANKMRESVSDFIKQNPETASKLLNRWISVEH